MMAGNRESSTGSPYILHLALYKAIFSDASFVGMTSGGKQTTALRPTIIAQRPTADTSFVNPKSKFVIRYAVHRTSCS